MRFTHPSPTPWQYIDVIRTAVQYLQLAPDPALGTPEFQHAVAELLQYEADTLHQRIGAEHRGPRAGWAVMCSCGGMSVQRGKRLEPCGRLLRAHAVADTYLAQVTGPRPADPLEDWDRGREDR